MVFGAVVKADSLGQLRRGVKCAVSPQGLSITKGKSPPLLLPVGTPAAWEKGNAVHVDLPGRRLSLTVNKFGSYQSRLARDVAAFLRGERPVPQDAEYKLEPYLLVLAFLPLGIMAVTRGGAIWGAVGGGLMGACLVVAQNERLPKAARLAIILSVTALAYAAVIALVASAAGPSR